jgi:hypothetical protein
MVIDASPAPSIHWPPDLDPSVASLHTTNELDTELSPEQLWPWLIHARRWPELYVDASHVRTPAPELVLGMQFTWRTLGVRVTTVVEELIPNERLAWRGRGLLGAQGYHAWVFTRRGRGTRLVTEETQRGVVPSLFRSRLERRLVDCHQRWLEGLARAASLGHPGSLPALPPR